MSKLKLDLHPVYNKGDQIDKSLHGIIDEAEDKKIDEVEIVCGKGSGKLKKRVLRFLDQKEVKQRYHRLKKDQKNSGRVFIYFQWK